MAWSPINLGDYCYFFSLQVGVITVSCMGFTVFCIVFSVNLINDNLEANEGIRFCHYFIVYGLCIFAFVSYLLGLFSAYRLSSKLALAAGCVHGFLFAVWLTVLIFSFSDNPKTNRFVCINNRCADRLFIQDALWRHYPRVGENRTHADLRAYSGLRRLLQNASRNHTTRKRGKKVDSSAQTRDGLYPLPQNDDISPQTLAPLASRQGDGSYHIKTQPGGGMNVDPSLIAGVPLKKSESEFGYITGSDKLGHSPRSNITNSTMRVENGNGVAQNSTLKSIGTATEALSGEPLKKSESEFGSANKADNMGHSPSRAYIANSAEVAKNGNGKAQKSASIGNATEPLARAGNASANNNQSLGELPKFERMDNRERHYYYSLSIVTSVFIAAFLLHGTLVFLSYRKELKQHKKESEGIIQAPNLPEQINCAVS